MTDKPTPLHRLAATFPAMGSAARKIAAASSHLWEWFKAPFMADRTDNPWAKMLVAICAAFRLAILATLLLAAWCILAGPAFGQDRLCGARESIVAQLEARHGESRVNIGLQGNSAVVEVFANRETGSWTILLTTPTGDSCLLAAGEAFQEFPAAAAAEGDPS